MLSSIIAVLAVCIMSNFGSNGGFNLFPPAGDSQRELVDSSSAPSSIPLFSLQQQRLMPLQGSVPAQLAAFQLQQSDTWATNSSIFRFGTSLLGQVVPQPNVQTIQPQLNGNFFS